MQSQRLKDTLEALRRPGGYVVIEAPSTSSSADAQSLASLADAAILAVELRRSRRPALLDAVEQLQRVGTPLLGAVVLPRLSGLRTSDVQAPAVTLSPPTGRPLLDNDMTQPMRFPTGTLSAGEKGVKPARAVKPARPPKAVSNPHPTGPNSPNSPAVRQRATDPGDEITAVIDMSGAVKAGNPDGPDGDQK
jgi:hypothetical protein